MGVFDNFKLLRDDMLNNGWIIDSFPFQYKNRDYIVLAKLYQHNERRPEFSLMKVDILRQDDISINITLHLNANGFIIGAKELREFFGIEYAKNIGDILQQFNQNFALFVPTRVTPNKPQYLKDAMVKSLSKSDSEDPDKLYCFDVKRNAINKNRTPFNDNKTKLLRPDLYLIFQADQTISFCYSADKKQEENDGEILRKFTIRNQA